MSKYSFEQHATLPNMVGTHLPPIFLAISADFQCCVDAGVHSAAYFLEELTTCSLHDHIAASSRVFINKIKCLLAVHGDNRPFNPQHFIDSFVAGYLGRIQQNSDYFIVKKFRVTHLNMLKKLGRRAHGYTNK